MKNVVARGLSVTFLGPFASHALTAGVAPNRLSDPPGIPQGPIDQVTTGTEATVTFTSQGVLPVRLPTAPGTAACTA